MKSITESSTPVLIVDDNQQYIQILRRMLEGAFGYKNITLVETPEAAVQALSGAPEGAGLIFVDYNLSASASGVDLLNQLRGAGCLKNRVAFLITADPTVDNVQEALKAGALGVVAKPFDRSELAKQLEKAERFVVAESTDSF